MTLGFTEEVPDVSRHVAEAMLDDMASGKAVPSSEPTPIAPRQRRQRSDAGIPRGPRADTILGPKRVGVDGDIGTEVPRRRRTAKGEPNITPEQITDMIVMAHTIAETMVSPKAAIKEADAKKIAAAMIPVMNDFGVVIVGKVVHVVSLIAAVVVVEGPIAWAVMKDAQQQAAAQRNLRQTVGVAVPQADASGSAAQVIAAQTGLEVGTPFEG